MTAGQVEVERMLATIGTVIAFRSSKRLAPSLATFMDGRPVRPGAPSGQEPDHVDRLGFRGQSVWTAVLDRLA